MLTSDILLLLAVIAFFILIIFLGALCCYACIALRKLTQTVKLVNSQLAGLGSEPFQLLQQTNQMSKDLNEKMKCLMPLFQSVDDLGKVLAYQSSHYKENFMHEHGGKNILDKEQEPLLGQALQLALLGLYFWKRFHKKG